MVKIEINKIENIEVDTVRIENYSNNYKFNEEYVSCLYKYYTLMISKYITITIYKGLFICIYELNGIISRKSYFENKLYLDESNFYIFTDENEKNTYLRNIKIKRINEKI